MYTVGADGSRAFDGWFDTDPKFNGPCTFVMMTDMKEHCAPSSPGGFFSGGEGAVRIFYDGGCANAWIWGYGNPPPKYVTIMATLYGGLYETYKIIPLVFTSLTSQRNRFTGTCDPVVNPPKLGEPISSVAFVLPSELVERTVEVQP